MAHSNSNKPDTKNSNSDPQVPLNYRGISLLPVISKMYTVLVGTWVGCFLEKNGILMNEQNGFRPNRSCTDHIFTLCDLLRICKSNNEQTFCAFINFQKVFDLLNHKFLLYTIRQIGLSGRVYETIKSMYSSPISCVNVNDRLVDWLHIGSGIRKGDSLSPILFAIFIIDLA